MKHSIYQIVALADIASNYLKTIYGEYLSLANTTNYDLSLLEEILKEGKYESAFRLYLLFPDERINYEIPQEDIIIDSGNYTENYQNGQRRNLNISLVNKDGKYTPNINSIWVSNKFRLDIGISYQGETFWFPRGIFLMENPTSNHEDSDKTVSLNLVDKFALLEGKMGTLETTYEIPAGSNIKEAIQGILTLDNGSGYSLDLKPIIYDHSFEGKTTPYTLRKDAGSTFGEMILELADMIGAEVFYNNFGNLCFIPINETILDDNKPVAWHLSEDEKIFTGSSSSYDFTNIVNEVNVVGDNINNKIVSAVARNEDPSSPICIQRIGRHVSYLSEEAIYSDELAQDRANYELRKASILGTTVTVTTAFNPLIFVDNIITIEDDFYKYKRERFVVQSISYSIGTNSQMTLTCSNVSNKSFIADDSESILKNGITVQTGFGTILLIPGRG